MLNWDINSLNRIQEEMIKQAEKDHLAQEVIDDMRKVQQHYNPTLAWLGRRMLDVGVKLIQISGSDDENQPLYKPDIHLN